MDTQTIRRGLYSIQTRAATMDDLIAAGSEAVPLVVPLLQDRDEGVRWAAIRILGEVGDRNVVLPLVTLMEQGKNVPDVVQALRAITGEALGDKGTAWREWALRSHAESRGSSAGFLSNEELVKMAVKGLPATMSGGGQEFEVCVRLADRRSQGIRIDFSGKDEEGNAVVQLTTPCGPAEAKHYETALKLNMSIAYGAVGVALLDDVLAFALIDTHLRATMHPEALAKSIMSLARQGDALERRLTAKDTF